MKPMNAGIDLGAESGEDLTPSTAALEARLAAVRERLREIADAGDEAAAAGLHLDEAALLLELDRPDEAHESGRRVFDGAMVRRDIESAAQACRTIYHCDGDDALAALGQGVWLAVTFPVAPSLTVSLLQLVVDDTPDDADGAAVAAATAAYVVDLRASEQDRRDLEFETMRLMGDVARRHGGVETQAEFDAWTQRLELTDPDRFLVRLRNVVDVLVQDRWWFDVDRLRDELPVH